VLLPLSLDRNSVLPDRHDSPGGEDVPGRIALHQDKIGAKPGFDPSPVGEAECARRRRGRGRERLRGRHARINEERQFSMDRSAVGLSRSRRVGPRQYRRAKPRELTNGVVGSQQEAGRSRGWGSIPSN